MKKFNQSAAQGDIYFRRIDKLPKGVVAAERERSRVTVAHSETGHDHAFADPEAVTMYRLPHSIMDCFLVFKKDAVLEHHRPHDTHESIQFKAGDVVHGRRQREHSPEGWRRVED